MDSALELDGSNADYPVHPELLPTATYAHGRWRARFARSRAELDRVLRLRYEVFNLELGEGLDSSHATGRDEDPFDARCHHLLVEETARGSVVGTYRMQTIEMARAGHGFYSAGEFDLSCLPREILDQSIEVGRACIHRDHRHKQVLFLLWQGLAGYVRSTGKRYLFGCSSLTSQDPAAGARLLAQLEQQGHVHAELRVPPLPSHVCEAAAGDVEKLPPIPVPTLFRTYLRYGAKVISRPALDREFKTIDYLTLLDVAELSPRTRRIFFGEDAPVAPREPE